MAFSKTEEVLNLDEGYVRRSVGEFIISFIETDWQQWIDRAIQLQQENRQTGDVARNFKRFYKVMLDELGHRHPFLRVFVTKQVRHALMYFAQESASQGCSGMLETVRSYIDNLEDDQAKGEMSNADISVAIEKCKQYFIVFRGQAEKIRTFVEKVLDQDNAEPNQSIYQRYAWFRASEPAYQESAPRAYEQLWTELQVELNNRVITTAKTLVEEQGEILKGDITSERRKRPAVRRYWVTDALEALLYLEFDYMVEEQVPLRKCVHCGRYFRPYSSAARYCSRPLQEDEAKTCKDVGAMSRYQQKVDADEAKKLLQKVANRHQMWVRRQLNDIAKLKLYRWRRWAETQLSAVNTGKIGFDEFKEELDIPSSVAMELIKLSEEELAQYRKDIKKHKD